MVVAASALVGRVAGGQRAEAGVREAEGRGRRGGQQRQRRRRQLQRQQRRARALRAVPVARRVRYCLLQHQRIMQLCTLSSSYCLLFIGGLFIVQASASFRTRWLCITHPGMIINFNLNMFYTYIKA